MNVGSTTCMIAVANMQAQHASILVDEEIETFQEILYPSLEEFLEILDHREPHWDWSSQFLLPLKKMGVDTLDEIDLATPESLHILWGLPPIPVMDLFERVHDTIQSIHYAKHFVIAPWQ